MCPAGSASAAEVSSGEGDLHLFSLGKATAHSMGLFESMPVILLAENGAAPYWAAWPEAGH